jgi:hypothetical protein
MISARASYAMRAGGVSVSCNFQTGNNEMELLMEHGSVTQTVCRTGTADVHFGNILQLMAVYPP